VAAHVLQAQHHGCQFVRLHLPPLAQLADLVVLAVLAVQVTPGEEDRPRAAPADQRRFLPEVGVATGYDGPLPRAADRTLGAFPAVHATLPGADVARLQPLVCLLDFFLQLAGAEEF